jgi:membrane-bound metal-dependent hydrolase YbcI (DUF457 family)
MARPVPHHLLWSTVMAWVVADAAQGVVGPSLLWALLDEVAHGAVAATCALWLVPRWGLRPVVVAVLAATLIDVDHAIAGGSLAPERMMQLSARPPTHSLLAALGLAILAGMLGGTRIGHAVGVGTLTHILRDATASPGVPLLAPVLEDRHVILPFWIVPATVVGLSVLHAAVASDVLRRRPGARPWSAGR